MLIELELNNDIWMSVSAPTTLETGCMVTVSVPAVVVKVNTVEALWSSWVPNELKLVSVTANVLTYAGS